jgi:hypothetical protein
MPRRPQRDVAQQQNAAKIAALSAIHRADFG